MNFKKDGVSKDNLLSLMAKEMDVSDWPSDAEYAVCASGGYQCRYQNRVAFSRDGRPRKDERDSGWTMFAHSGSFDTVCDWLCTHFHLSEVPYDWYHAIVPREQFMQAKQSIGSKENTKMKEPVRTQRKFGDYVDNSKLTGAELRVFIDDAEAMGFGNDNDEAEYPFTGIQDIAEGGRVGGRTVGIVGDRGTQDVTHEYQGLSQQCQGSGSEDVHENVITETGVYRGRANGYDVIIHTIDYENGVAYGYDTQDSDQEKYCVKSGDRFEFNYDRYPSTGVDRKDSQRKTFADIVDVTVTLCRTPAQKQGWAVGDIGIVLTENQSVGVGDVVELVYDDYTHAPKFHVCRKADTKDPVAYKFLEDLVHIGTKQQFLDMFFNTPAKRQGWGLDVYGIVTTDCRDIIQESSVVELYRQEDDHSPLWKVLSGKSRYNNCDGQQGAYLGLGYITKINLTADLYDTLSQ